ncbi:MAG: molybdenum cofactor guanylyltransferase [Candidatus Bipolaricaulota bacterium]|nr:molybdenum cofactor guanylyltransferase [Candidatus Bipolaricaulota bacterium]MDW8031427.1 molybdenum cofactor guanylyltransferase [Candidatus Bipolaricaulota bacterium]
MRSERVFSVIILAGGRSQRVGREKALLPWGGRTLIEHIVAQCRRWSDDVLVTSGDRVRYQEILDVPIFADAIRDIGPMGGLYTGLKHARYEYSLAVACDMPFITRAVIDLLRAELDGSVWAVVPKIEGHRVPTFALYHKKCLSVIEQLLAQRCTSPLALLDAVPIAIVPEERFRAVDPTLRSFTNINTLQDWERSLKLSL